MTARFRQSSAWTIYVAGAIVARHKKARLRFGDRMFLSGFFSQIFTWWNGNTPWTRFFTWRHGKQIGADQFGNRYFTEKNGSRRWVIYNGEAEASIVPPLWHAWLHHTIDAAPLGEQQMYDWEKAHQPNLTGTAAAYRPPGDISGDGRREPATGDYQAWRPS